MAQLLQTNVTDASLGSVTATVISHTPNVKQPSSVRSLALVAKIPEHTPIAMAHIHQTNVSGHSLESVTTVISHTPNVKQSAILTSKSPMAKKTDYCKQRSEGEEDGAEQQTTEHEEQEYDHEQEEYDHEPWRAYNNRKPTFGMRSDRKKTATSWCAEQLPAYVRNLTSGLFAKYEQLSDGKLTSKETRIAQRKLLLKENERLSHVPVLPLDTPAPWWSSVLRFWVLFGGHQFQFAWKAPNEGHTGETGAHSERTLLENLTRFLGQLKRDWDDGNKADAKACLKECLKKLQGGGLPQPEKVSVPKTRIMQVPANDGPVIGFEQWTEELNGDKTSKRCLCPQCTDQYTAFVANGCQRGWIVPRVSSLLDIEEASNKGGKLWTVIFTTPGGTSPSCAEGVDILKIVERGSKMVK